MADHADITDARIAFVSDHKITEIRLIAAGIPKGEEGECPLCGEYSLRIVRNACPPCRDKYGLP